MKKRLTFCLLLCLLVLLAGCSKDKKVASAEAAQAKQPEHSYWDILEAYTTNHTPCEISVTKNYGGQATGLSCIVYIPLANDADLTDVPLELTLMPGANIRDEEGCIRLLNGWLVRVDLTVPDPTITIENEGYSRTYDLVVVRPE